MTDQNTSITPAAPSTPAEATARLDVLTADPAWAGKLLSGSGPVVKEFQDLMKMKTAGDPIASILDGTAVSPLIETVTDGKLTTYKQMLGVEQLREAGVGDEGIRQLFEGKPVSKAEYDAVAAMRADCLGDADWTKKLLAGDRATRREFTLMNIVLVGGFKEAAA